MSYPPNEAVIALLAKARGTPKRAVRIVSGATSRHKRVEIEGVEAARVTALVTAGPRARR